MGPTKAVIKENTLYEAKSGKLLKDGSRIRKISKTMSITTTSCFRRWIVKADPGCSTASPSLPARRAI